MPAQGFPSKLFRRQALAASAAGHLGRVRMRRPAGMRAAIAAALAVTSLAAVASALIEIATLVDVDGVLLPPGGIAVVRAPKNGVVSSLAVAEGSAVSRGQRLFRVAGQLHRAGDGSALEAERRLIDRELRLLAEAGQREEASARQRAKSLEAEQAILELELAAAERQVAARRRTQVLRARQAERAAKLENAAIAAQQADEEAVRSAEAAGRAVAAEQQRLGLEGERLAVARALGRERDELAAIRVRTRQRVAALERERLALERRISVPVTSPDGGIVAALLVREGSTVRAGQHVASIVDPDLRVDAYFYLGADTAVRVERGQLVELEFAGWPREIHGTVTARVLGLSGAPVPAASLAVPLAVPGFVFEVRARLHADAPLARRLRAGSVFRARLVETRQPLYRWVAGQIAGRG